MESASAESACIPARQEFLETLSCFLQTIAAAYIRPRRVFLPYPWETRYGYCEWASEKV